jgi:hypothetical protein
MAPNSSAGYGNIRASAKSFRQQFMIVPVEAEGDPAPGGRAAGRDLVAA